MGDNACNCGDPEAAWGHLQTCPRYHQHGLCCVCEKNPLAPDDVLCAECRDYVERTSSTVVDPVEMALNAHQLLVPLSSMDSQTCMCGWCIESGPGYHRRHLAEKVYEALGLPGPMPWIDGPDVVHPAPSSPVVTRNADPPTNHTIGREGLTSDQGNDRKKGAE